MTIPILVESNPAGFVATTGGPLNLSAEATSAAEAIQAVQRKITRRLESGAVLIEHPVQQCVPPIPVLPLSENPLLETWLQAVETYRTQQDAQAGLGATEAP
jgi:hypothetical protein